ncbi:MAG: CRTAC1 family protein, partial [Gemmataceae bacterium]|nr:CRTAC1 family protein [Gemmataceae bacterium]
TPVSGVDPPWSWYAERNQLFANDGRGRFRDLSAVNPTWSGRPGVYRGLACGDFDGDGAVDLLVTCIAGPARLFRNVAPQHGHWLKVRALDPALKREAYGAEITVRAGGRSWTGLLNPGSSYLCSHEAAVHIGLGPLKRLDHVEVQWPDGAREVFPGAAVDRTLVLRRGEGRSK